MPVEVPVKQRNDVTARQGEDAKAVAIPREREEKPVAEHTRPTRDRKQVVPYGVEEQINVAEEVTAYALCAAEMDEPKMMNQAKKRPDGQKWMKASRLNMMKMEKLRGTSVGWLHRGIHKPRESTTMRRSHR